MAVSFKQRRALGKRYAIDPAYLLEAQRLDKQISQQPYYAQLAEQQRQFAIQQKNQEDAQKDASQGEMVSGITNLATLPAIMYGKDIVKGVGGLFSAATGTSAVTPAITTGGTAVASNAALTGGANAITGAATTTGSVATGAAAPGAMMASAATAPQVIATDAVLTASAEGAVGSSSGAAATSGLGATLGGGLAAVGGGVSGGFAGSALGQLIGDKLGIGGKNERGAVGGALGGAAGGWLMGASIGSVGGPVGAVVGAVVGGVIGLVSCFLAGTPITMSDGTVKNIEDVDVWDDTKGGGLVTGVGKLLSGDLYDYNGVMVSGSHAVYEDGVWIRVRDSKEAVKIDIGTVPVYTINNVNHRLLINGITFADYGEVTDSEDWTQQERLDFLNGATLESSEIQCNEALSAAC